MDALFINRLITKIIKFKVYELVHKLRWYHEFTSSFRFMDFLFWKRYFMKKFKNLDKRNVNQVENDITKKWDEMDLLDKSINNRKDNDTFVFYDGPATANGMPGAHHMLAKILKDTFCKYETMQGKKVLRKVGWDTRLTG